MEIESIETQRVIDRFEINIGQYAPFGMPEGDPAFSIVLNDMVTTCKLEQLKNWINDIWESQGNRSQKAYKAKNNLFLFLAEALEPFIIYKKTVEDDE